MSKSPHPVVCPTTAIKACEVDCVQARVAVEGYLTSNPVVITALTLGGLNRINNCSCPECVALRQQVNARFSRIPGGD